MCQESQGGNKETFIFIFEKGKEGHFCRGLERRLHGSGRQGEREGRRGQSDGRQHTRSMGAGDRSVSSRNGERWEHRHVENPVGREKE